MSNTTTEQHEARKRDHDWWLAVAKSAGKHGIRYRTNSALVAFMADVAAVTPPAPAPDNDLLTKAVGDISAALVMAGKEIKIAAWTAPYVEAINHADAATPNTEPAGGGGAEDDEDPCESGHCCCCGPGEPCCDCGAIMPASELDSYEKFDGVGQHSETIETRARIGESYLEAYASALTDPLLVGYTPADCPSELLLDLLERLREAQPAGGWQQEQQAVVLALRALLEGAKAAYIDDEDIAQAEAALAALTQPSGEQLGTGELAAS